MLVGVEVCSSFLRPCLAEVAKHVGMSHGTYEMYVEVNSVVVDNLFIHK
jgi:hypothetical protein